jgi:sarcosine/dimethylglycine N-methyltransferase
MGDATTQTIYFYDRHPISLDIILAKLRASRGHLDGLRPDDLFPYDQDHYGGLAATDELARGAQITSGSRVADLCAGLGGTVRYLAHKYGAKVTGIELTPSRVSGAQELIKRVGLQDEARVVEGNVMSVPLAMRLWMLSSAKKHFAMCQIRRRPSPKLFGFSERMGGWLSRIGSPTAFYR